MTIQFSDIQDHWAEDCITQLAERNLIQGYKDGSFKPEQTLTRAEFSALLQAAFPETEKTREPIAFNDLEEEHWAFAAIQFAYQTGFLSGYPEQLFKPDISMPRVQAIAALASGLGYEAPEEGKALLEEHFDDATEIPDYAVEAIAAAVQAKLVTYYPETKELKPNQAVTRGELAALLCQALEVQNESIAVANSIRTLQQEPTPSFRAANQSPSIAYECDS
ncbi:MAG: S-layer homology domain-containing protein [Leptolyngbya sp. SIO1D8]|nr:S-layer homology domain-containing protein [Leptolyngbya sp. SIO1D8]